VHRGALDSCLCILLGAACSDPQGVSLPEIEWEGEHLRAGGDLDEACGGNLPYMDALVGELQQRLGTPGDGLVDYYYFTTDVDETPLGDYCESGDSVGLLACTNEDQEVFSRAIPHEHELVHAVHAEVGFSHTFLEEGLAEFLGDDGHMAGRGAPMGTVSEAIASVERGRLPLGYYALAGHFVSFLDDELAPSGSIERIDDIDFEASAHDVEAALGLGVDGGFAALEDEYQATSKCAQAAYRDAEPMCNVAAPLFEQCTPSWDPSADVYVNVDCSDSDVLGPRQDEIWTYRTFEILNAGTYHVLATASTELANGIVLKRCGGGCQSAPITIPTLAEEDFLVQEDVELEPGRYLVRFTRPVDEPATIRIRFAGDACE
jgi:hypothetical protein